MGGEGSKRCPDKTSGEEQNVRRQNVRRHKSRRHNVRGTKRQEGQNVRKDKTSGGTKRPAGQNVRRGSVRNKF
jgi:hypothetical protein